VPARNPFHPDELFADYVAECDEHLTAAVRTLLDLEADPDRVDPTQLHALFRNFHTVKGLSGMVGLGDAERLAHQLETYLGAVRKSHTTLSADGVTHLIEGVRTLEQIIAARRDQTPPPDVNYLLTRVTSLIPDQPRTVPKAAPPDEVSPASVRGKIDGALKQGAKAWRVTFTPSATLSDRGVSVNTVREQLKALGEIVAAEPTVVAGGGIRFAFLVTSRADDFASAVPGEGVAVEPFAALPSGPATPSLASPSLVRVDLGRLDDLMRTIGELVITRARLDNGLGRVASALPAAEWRALQETSQVMERQLRVLREGVMRVRLVPIRDIFARMRFVVRDLAQETHKEIDLGLVGEETEIDKFVVERLADPLLHLVRNAVSHGLESTAERVAAGKPPQGRLDLRAATAGGVVVIEVEDDGRGIDPDQVFTQAEAAGLVLPGTRRDAAAVLDLICMPGFSTRETVDRASGRGVGMDVVRQAVEELGGTLDLDTRRGAGTRFIVRVPLTPAIADALIVAVGTQTYAALQASIREVVLVEPAALTALENNELLRHPGGVLPLLRLGDLFQTARPSGPFPALVVGEGVQAIALAVDRVIGLREIVVRPMADPLLQVHGLAGATELGDGRAVLILDAIGLSRYARTRRRPA